MKWVLALLLLSVGCAKSEDPILFVIAGNERALGKTYIHTLPDSLQELPRNVILTRSSKSIIKNYVGPEWGFAHQIVKHVGTKRPVWVIKHAAAGTTYEGWRKDWSGSAGTKEDRATCHYGALMRLVHILTDGKRYEIGALLWIHPDDGEFLALALMEDFAWAGALTIHPNKPGDDIEVGMRLADIYGEIAYVGPSSAAIMAAGDTTGAGMRVRSRLDAQPRIDSGPE